MIHNYSLNYTRAWYKEFIEALNSKVVYKKTYAQAKNKCMLCSATKPSKILPLVEHNHENKTIVFKRFIAVCDDCNNYHKLSTLADDEDGVTGYLMELLRLSQYDVTTLIDDAYERYVMSIKYAFDFSEIDDTEYQGYRNIPSKF